MWLTHFWHSWNQFFIFAWDVTAGGILRTGVLICLVSSESRISYNLSFCLLPDPEDPAVYYKTNMIPPASEAPAGYQNHHYLHHLSPDMERQHLCAIADNACVGHQGNYIDHQGNVPLRIISNRLDNDLAEGYIVVPGVHHASLDSGLCSSTPNVAHL